LHDLLIFALAISGRRWCRPLASWDLFSVADETWPIVNAGPNKAPAMRRCHRGSVAVAEHEKSAVEDTDELLLASMAEPIPQEEGDGCF